MKKGTIYKDECVAWLMSLSKAALCDCVVDLLRGGSECAEEEIPESRAIDRLSAVLAMRGDRIPKGMMTNA